MEAGLAEPRPLPGSGDGQVITTSDTVARGMKGLRTHRRRKQRFLEALAETGNVTLAARSAGISRPTVYLHRQSDDEFAQAWEEAEQIAADKLEAEAWRRGVEGVSEPLASAGKLVRDDAGRPLTIQRYSDQLLLALLRAHRPEKFRERTAVEFDVSDRLADRLEAARQRAIAKREDGGTPLDLQAVEIKTTTLGDDSDEARG